MDNRLLFLCFFLVFGNVVSGQTEFIDNTSTYIPDTFFRSTLTVGVADVNGDFLDDIITLHEGNKIVVGINRGEGQGFRLVGTRDSVSSIPEWSFAVGDLNNDGKAEILTTGVYNRLKIFSYADDVDSLIPYQNIPTNAYGQGCNIIDYNNDGWNDFFLSNDDGESRLFVNDGNGRLELLTDKIDFTTDPPSDMSGNYGSDWVDLDGDGVLEFYLAKCSAVAPESTDPRRINQLYALGEDGIYRDIAKSVGLADGAQSWTSVFADMDNDGDLDLAVANHYSPHVLMENIDGNFSNVNHPVVEEIFTFQVAAGDFDNNGFIDLLFTGGDDFIMYNQGNWEFVVDYQPFGIFGIHAGAIGDLNQDGNLDVYASYGIPIIDPGYRGDKIWMGTNKAGSNYFSMALMGKTVNPRAIGAKVLLYGPWGIQQRNVRAGQGYSLVNSATTHFGLGNHESIDSAVVIWPGGSKQVLTDMQPNQHYLLEEGGCPSLLKEGVSYQRFCPGDSIVMEVETGAEEIRWNDGTDSAIFTIDESGLYYYVAIDSLGCRFRSPLMWAEQIASLQKPESVVSGLPLNCQEDFSISFTQDSIILLDEEFIFIGREEYYEIYNLRYTYGDVCGNTWIDSLEVREVSFPSELGKDSIEIGDTLILPVLGDSTVWYKAQDTEVGLTKEEYTQITELTSDTSFFAEIYLFPEVDTFSVTAPRRSAESAYTVNTLNRAMYFDVVSPFVLESVTCYTDLAGERTIEIIDDSGELVFSKDVNLIVGANKCNLGVSLPAGRNYRITTNAEKNMASFGFSAPRLERSDLNIIFPYSIPGYLDINGIPGVGAYYYFYDWVITPMTDPCISNRLERSIYVDIDNSTKSPLLHTLIVSPNPTSHTVQIEGKEIPKVISIVDLSGREVSRQIINKQGLIDFTTLPDGLYIIKGMVNDKTYLGKVVKQ